MNQPHGFKTRYIFLFTVNDLKMPLIFLLTLCQREINSTLTIEYIDIPVLKGNKSAKPKNEMDIKRFSNTSSSYFLIAKKSIKIFDILIFSENY